jgi:hypothetical protein
LSSRKKSIFAKDYVNRVMTNSIDTEGIKMRKRFKLKKRACPLCRPNKCGWACRWSAKENAILHEAEKNCAEAVKKGKQNETE